MKIVKIYLTIIALLLFVGGAAIAGSPDSLPQAKGYEEAKALAYLQRAYFSLEQAMYYAQKSKEMRPLGSCDYKKLLTDIGSIHEDLGLYLYPRSDKIKGDAQPFRIDGDYFLDDIIKNK